MNNPLRDFIQEYVEFKRIRKFSVLDEDSTVLEIGCGAGNGSQLIKKYFDPETIYAIDLDERMIDIARRKRDDSINFQVGDATDLGFQENTFDVVFDLGAIHHIPEWKTCIQEISRVLKPNGHLLAEDLSRETFSTPLGRLMRKFSDHPYGSMYSESEFMDYLQKNNLELKTHQVYTPIIRYFLIIAEKKD